MSDAIPALPAATVVVLRPGDGAPEVLLLRRNAKLAFHGGAWVFPGGRVDPADAEGHDERDARRAAVRETREEAGLDLDPTALVALSHWTTPEGVPKRFATWFYLVASPGSAVRVDGSEIRDHRWCTPAQAIAAQRAGEIELPPPTFVTLSVLASHRTVEAALAAATAEAPLLYRPRIVRGDTESASLYPGDAGFASRVLEAPGARHRLCFRTAGWHYVRDVDVGERLASARR